MTENLQQNDQSMHFLLLHKMVSIFVCMFRQTDIPYNYGCELVNIRTFVIYNTIPECLKSSIDKMEQHFFMCTEI